MADDLAGGRIHRGRHTASLLVVGLASGPYSGKHKTTGMNVQFACTLGSRGFPTRSAGAAMTISA